MVALMVLNDKLGHIRYETFVYTSILILPLHLHLPDFTYWQYLKKFLLWDHNYSHTRQVLAEQYYT